MLISPSRRSAIRRAAGAFAAGLSAAAAATACAQAAGEHVELIESAPAGTELRTPGTLDTATALRDLIRDARRSIDLLGALPSDATDAVAAPLLAGLRAAAARGVKVRVLQAVGQAEAALGAQAGIERRGVTIPGGLGATAMIIDQRHALLSSARLDRAGLGENHELGVAFTGRLVDRLERIFEQDWALAGEQAARRAAPTPEYVRRRGGEEIDGLIKSGPVLAVSPPTGGQLAGIDVLLSLIDHARRSIVLQGPVLSTEGRPRWTELRDALSRAARRNVAIRLSVSDRQLLRPGGLEDAKAIARLPGARVRISAIPQRPEECVPHARTDNASYLVVDGGMSWIGTGAWTAGDLYAARNLAYVSAAPELARKVAAVFETAWSSGHMTRVDERMRVPRAPDLTCTGSKAR